MRSEDVRNAERARLKTFPHNFAAFSTPKIQKFDAASAEIRLSKWFRAVLQSAHDDTRRAQSQNANFGDAQRRTRAVGEFCAEN